MPTLDQKEHSVSSQPAPPARGFPRAEFVDRFQRAQQFMVEARLDALLVTTPQQIRYFTGFDSQFWESPTRPWYVVLPVSGSGPIAVIPEIGAPGMAVTWVEDIRTWPAPRPDDDGVTLLSETLREVAGSGGRVGAELGRELSLRMPLNDLEAVRARSGVDVVDGTSVVRGCRHVKSELEIDRIRFVCSVASASYAEVPNLYRRGDTERDVVQKYRRDVIARGADTSPYLIGVAGPGGYDNIVMGPTDREIIEGDVLIIDTGTTYDGYFCDFDRNWAFGSPTAEVARAHQVVWDATEAGIAAATPGATVEEVWKAMDLVLTAGGSLGNNVGRLGHGLGLQLTEPPSNMPGDTTVLLPGTVLTIEPGMEFAPGRMMVHEENIVIREDGAELLTVRAPRDLPVIPWN
ncbi:MAG: Xaa-Pro peptidase family protein [Actinomycetes bacterium]